MPYREGMSGEMGAEPKEHVETEQEKRARAISIFIEDSVIGGNESLSKEEEKEIVKSYEKMSPREKTDELYDKMMAFMVDRQAEFAHQQEAKGKDEAFEPEIADPYLISEIKILFGDEKVKELIPATYGEARVNQRRLKISEVGKLWETVVEEIAQKEATYKKLEQDLFLSRVKGEGKISVAKSRKKLLAKNLTALKNRKQEMEKLEGFPQTQENADSVALFQFEQLREYQRQMKEGFVWLLSRNEILQETVDMLTNHRCPVLIGETGSGKSALAKAAALELTGLPPTNILCDAKTGELGMIKDKDIGNEGGSFETYAGLMRAISGLATSKQKEPSDKIGLIARFEEAYRMSPDSEGYTIFKMAREAMNQGEGAEFYGKPVRPGAAAIWTTNPVGDRYKGRFRPDPAMRRELGEIKVKNLDMTVERPELFEFAITALLDKRSHISVAKEELAPAYEKVEIPETDRKPLVDGSIPVAKDQIIADMADPRHGALYRFTAAIHALQESFDYGNAQKEGGFPDSLLRYNEVGNNIEVKTDGSGTPLTLSTSTITVGEFESWMEGFNVRLEKLEEKFRRETLTEWLNFKIQTYLKQADDTDKEKLTAIFKHFHFLDGKVPDLKDAKPMTPKDIGYLSPRVPRPLYVERLVEVVKTVVASQEGEKKEAVKYETKQVLLEDGTRVLIKTDPFVIGTGDTAQTVKVGKKLRVADGDFAFSGIVDDASSKYNGRVVGRPTNGEELYRVFETQELEQGIFVHESETLMEKIDKKMPEYLGYYWKAACEGNAENNPENLALAV